MPPGRRAQIWRHQPAFRRPRHFHDEPELNLVVAGRCVVGVGDRIHVLTAGSGLFFQPGQDHVLVEASDDLDLFVTALSPALAERALGSGALAARQSTPFAVARVEALQNELAGLSAVADRGPVESRLPDLFAHAIRGASSTHVVSRRALEVARDEPTLSGAALARRLSTAPSLVSRRFRAEVGLTLVEYRARTKLMRFVELVDAGASLTRAALDAGFGSYAQCHRVFQRSVHCSPSDYFAGARAQVNAATWPKRAD